MYEMYGILVCAQTLFQLFVLCQECAFDLELVDVMLFIF